LLRLTDQLLDVADELRQARERLQTFLEDPPVMMSHGPEGWPGAEQ
jgi:hypothetical protein